MKTYPKAGRFEQVRKHLEALKADAGLAARIKQKAADKEAAGWLRMADNYISAGLNDKAKDYLKKIIDRYGDTTWGPKAKQRLKKIGG